MRRFPVVVAAATALITCLSAIVAAPALGAEKRTRYVHDDPAGDMEEVQPGAGGESGDFLRSVIRHRRHAIVIRSTFTDLVAEDFVTLHADLSTDAHSLADRGYAWRVVQIDWIEGLEPSASLYDVDSIEDIGCNNMSLNVDFDANTMRVRVPRPCLERPDWVRGDMFIAVHSGPGWESEWQDAAFSELIEGATSPRIFRESPQPVA